MKVMKRLFAIFLSAAIMLPIGTTMAFAETDTAESKDREIAMSVKEELYSAVKKNEVIEDAPSADFIRRSAAANECHNIILQHVDAMDDELRRHFSGAYLDSSCDLVILLSCDTSACKEQIIAETGYMDASFEDGNGSYYDTKAALEIITNRIYTMQEAVKAGEADAATVEVMKMYPYNKYDVKTNTISLILDVEPALLPYVMEPDSAEELAISRIPQELQHLANKYRNNVSVVNDRIIGNTPDTISLQIVPDTGYEQGVEETEEWRPGRYIFIATSDASTGSACSTGYRAKYWYSGAMYYGFVTCAHGNNIGNTVYISYPGSTTGKLGEILNRSYGGSVDVAFIRMTNRNYTNGQAVYYTSSQPGVTRQGAVLDGTQTTPSVNDVIYKSGMKTYLTWGHVESVDVQGYFNNTLFTYMIGADRAMSNPGDSGAVAYKLSGVGSYAKAVGVLKGKISGNTVFIRVDIIKRMFGAEAY